MKPIFKQITPLICEFEWQEGVSDHLLQRQLSFKTVLKEGFSSEINEIRMGFKTLSVTLTNSSFYQEIKKWLDSFNPEASLIPLSEKIWQIPVCYSLKTGRDIEILANSKNLSQKELIELHSQPPYRLHFYGFLPGFMYLNGLPETLHTERKSVPDREVPIGSVAIGGTQTGIYPSSSPGGWHLIGQTPIRLFDPSLSNPVFASPGEQIEFVPISKQEFDDMRRNPQKPTFR